MSDIDTDDYPDPFGLVDMHHAPIGTMLVKVADTPYRPHGHWVVVEPAEIVHLQELLAKHGGHVHGCTRGLVSSCDCGWDDVREGLGL